MRVNQFDNLVFVFRMYDNPPKRACAYRLYVTVLMRSVCDRYGNPKRVQRPSCMRCIPHCFCIRFAASKTRLDFGVPWNALFSGLSFLHIYICTTALGHPRSSERFFYVLICVFMCFLLSLNSAKSHDNMLLPLSDSLLLYQTLPHLPHW